MNPVMEAILNRRSHRKYKPEPIAPEHLESILEAAIFAPSGANHQPWHFTVIQNRELLDHIAEVTRDRMLAQKEDWIKNLGEKPQFRLFHNAPLAIVVSGKEGSYSSLTDCSAAVENMLIAAESLGIGTCWIGLVSFFFEDEEEVKKLKIPEGYKPFFAVTFGYKDPENPPRAPERKRDVFTFIQ